MGIKPSPYSDIFSDFPSLFSIFKFFVRWNWEEPQMREEKRYFNLLLEPVCTLQKSGGIHWPKFIDINRFFPFFLSPFQKVCLDCWRKQTLWYFLLLWVENKWKSENISSNSCAKKKWFKWSELNLIYQRRNWDENFIENKLLQREKFPLKVKFLQILSISTTLTCLKPVPLELRILTIFIFAWHLSQSRSLCKLLLFFFYFQNLIIIYLHRALW